MNQILLMHFGATTTVGYSRLSAQWIRIMCSGAACVLVMKAGSN